MSEINKPFDKNREPDLINAWHNHDLISAYTNVNWICNVFTSPNDGERLGK
jgi:hypothetical protein